MDGMFKKNTNKRYDVTYGGGMTTVFDKETGESKRIMSLRAPRFAIQIFKKNSRR